MTSKPSSVNVEIVPITVEAVLHQPNNSMMTEEGAWDTLKEADQLAIERSEGNVFHGFHEGKAFRQGPITL